MKNVDDTPTMIAMPDPSTYSILPWRPADDGGGVARMGANALAADYATHQVEVLVAIKGSDEEQAKATLLLAQALLAEDRIGDARVRAQRALELAESSDELRPMALILLARVLDRQGDIKEAGRLLDRADVDLRKSHVVCRGRWRKGWRADNCAGHRDAIGSTADRGTACTRSAGPYRRSPG